jgi:hypothetical protein
MLNQAEKAYYLALQALKSKQYEKALNYFHAAGDFFKDNREFSILRETTSLLLAVKEEIARAEGAAPTRDESIFVGEVLEDSGE